MRQNPFYNVKKDVVGHDPISLDAELMVSLKHLCLGWAATSAWQEYFQMGSTRSQTAVEELCHTILTYDTLQGQFLCLVTSPDAIHDSEMHEEAHDMLRILGLLDCMHV